MSWGTSFKQEVDIYRKYFSSKTEVEDEINDLKKQIERYKAELLSLASCTPKDIITKDEEIDDALDVIHQRFYNLWELLEDDMYMLYRLQGLLENFDSREEW